MDFLYRCLDLYPASATRVHPSNGLAVAAAARGSLVNNIRAGEIQVIDLVDIAIPANAQTAAEALGLRVDRSITNGTWVRGVPRDEAEIAVECLRDYGFSARIRDSADQDGRPPKPDIPRAA
jgi:hypothetical protein